MQTVLALLTSVIKASQGKEHGAGGAKHATSFTSRHHQQPAFIMAMLGEDQQIPTE
jgi:hypothetical protein